MWDPNCMLYAIFGECTFILSHYLRSVFTIAAFYVGGYPAALGACSSTLDLQPCVSALGEGPSVSSARVAIFVVRSSSKSASLEVVAARRTRRLSPLVWRRGQGHLLRARTRKDAPKNEHVSVRLPDDDVHLRIQYEGRR